MPVSDQRGDRARAGGRPVPAVAAVEVLEPREVPLGGPRAMRVRRTLPQRGRALIGAWCFVDHYGPDDVARTGGMVVPPHPHTGLQTVSWLFSGGIEHRDSTGQHATVRPGELNLMTAGHGISHSEVSTADTAVLHGVQLWIALPDDARDGPPGFRHLVPEAVRGAGWEARVFLGSLLGSRSPVPTASPLLGAEVVLARHTVLDLDVDPVFEHGVLVDAGTVGVRPGPTGPATQVRRHALAYCPPGVRRLRLESGEEPARLLLLAGPPFGEPIVMWWNFVGRSHEDVAAARDAWHRQVAAEGGVHPPHEAAGGLEEAGGPSPAVVPDTQRARAGRFGVVVGERRAPIPAPPMPQVRLRPRH